MRWVTLWLYHKIFVQKFEYPAGMYYNIAMVTMNTDQSLPLLPLDIQSLQKIRKDDFLYVDKTGFIAQLINSKLTYFFLSRPRRFGKSLLVSTMKEIFSGNKELFKNLQVYNEIQWESYPVIHFDFSLIAVDETILVKNALADEIDKIAGDFHLPITKGNHKAKLRFLIENLAKKEKKPVVILIDEYDKFIIDYIADDLQREKNRSQLKEFFSILKGSSDFIRFVFITGISRFSRVSIFSDLNNLIDLTFDPRYSAITGYTHNELMDYFAVFIRRFAEKQGCSVDSMVDLIARWYDGYSWDGQTRVYNPYSILKLFSDFRFGCHWYATGTPTVLIKAIRERKVKIQELDHIKEKRPKLENMEVTRLELIPLLFQTGYLTIIEKINNNLAMEQYILDYPNRDVRYSFLNHLLEDFSPGNPRLVDNITTAVLENRIDDMLENMKGILAAVPYDHFDPDREASYHSLIHVIFYLVLDNIGAEIHTNRGRIDEVIETDKYIYIFEFKMNSAQNALQQIHEQKYYEMYLNKGKKIVLVGVSFSREERNIGAWIIERHHD
jgi:hypothetical protein